MDSWEGRMAAKAAVRRADSEPGYMQPGYMHPGVVLTREDLLAKGYPDDCAVCFEPFLDGPHGWRFRHVCHSRSSYACRYAHAHHEHDGPAMATA